MRCLRALHPSMVDDIVDIANRKTKKVLAPKPMEERNDTMPYLKANRCVGDLRLHWFDTLLWITGPEQAQHLPHLL